MTNNDKISFSKYGKTFQEKLAFLILDDRVFADRMLEVLNVEFLEFKYLQTFVGEIFEYKKKYNSQPSHDTMATIVKSGLEKENEALQKQKIFLQNKCRKAGGAIFNQEQTIEGLKKEIDRLSEENANLRTMIGDK